MMLLPKKVGSFTLMRRLGSDVVTERYVAILDEPAGKQIVARHVHPAYASDPALRKALETRVADLVGVNHPTLVPVLGMREVDGALYVLEEWVDAVDVATIMAHGRDHAPLPHNVFLDLATQICNALEALHGRPGVASGDPHVLHMGLCPEAILVTATGKVRLSTFGLVASPTNAPQSAKGQASEAFQYLSPEQTHPDPALAPPSDLFALGSLLYEMLTLRPAFRAPSHLQTIHRIRRAETTTHLLEVKEILLGLDRVLYRALALNPRHRYQRAFVLREDLRGLMAGFSFADIEHDAALALAPMFGARSRSLDEVIPEVRAPDPPQETTAALLESARLDADVPAPAPAWGVSEDTTGLRRIPKGSDPLDSLGAAPPAAPDLGYLPESLATGMPMGTPQPPAIPDDDDDEATGPEHTGPTGDQNGLLELPREVTSEPPRGMLTPAAFAPPQGTDPVDAVPLSALSTQERPSPHGPPPSAVHTEEAVPVPRAERTRTPAPTSLVDEPAADADTMARMREQLAPPDSLIPPSDRVATQGADAAEGNDGGGLPVGMIAAAAAGLAAIALVGCLGLGGLGGVAGFLSLRTEAPELAEAPATAAPTPAPTAEPEPVAAALAPSPRERPAAAPDRPSPRPSSRPAPTVAPAAPAPAPARAPRPAAAPATAPAPAPAPRPVAAPAPPPAAETWAAVAGPSAAPPAAPEGTADDGALLPEGPVEAAALDALSPLAFQGALHPDDRSRLQGVGPSSDAFTRSHTLVYLDAKARGARADQATALALLMARPENQYNPALLVEQAHAAMEASDWPLALERAQLAERHWARLPSELIFSRKALIYEIEAKAHLGMFYASEGDEPNELYRSIRGWEKYRRHAEAGARADLVANADRELDALYDIQRRLE